MNKLIIRAVRHGEVLLQPIEDLPKGKTQKYTSFIVGHSETNHHHILESKTEFEVLEDALTKETYMRLFENATLVHKKTVNRHKDLVVPAGMYLIKRKQEYNPWTRLKQRVFD